MSAMAIDVQPVQLRTEQRLLVSVSQHPTSTEAPLHPRGRGFGVLSRIARGQSSDEYVPRHRGPSTEHLTAF